MSPKKPVEQPVATPVPEAPMQPQPMMQQPQQYAQQPVQYIMMEQSVKGVGGWLIFWLILFGLAALSYIIAFFTSMLTLSTAIGVVALIFTPLLAGGYIASVVMIAMEKKIGKLLTWITLGVSAIYTTINMIVSYITVSNVAQQYDYSYRYGTSYASDGVAQALPVLIGMIVATIVAHGLVALYFVLSKRVKETLVN